MVEHQGILPGFDSQIFAAPAAGVGVMALSNGTRRGSLWLPTEMGSLLCDLLGVPDATVRTDAPQRPDVWGDVCGWYYLPGPVTDVRVRMMFGAGVEVFVRGGRLMIRGLTPVPVLYRGFELHPDDPDDPYVFRLDLSDFDLGSIRLAFSRDAGAKCSAVHMDVMPLSAQRRPGRQNPRRWAQAAAALAAAALVGRVWRRRTG